MTDTDITVYVAQVPDAIKITILLEELGYVELCTWRSSQDDDYE